jgi:hypothetical protein
MSRPPSLPLVLHRPPNPNPISPQLAVVCPSLLTLLTGLYLNVADRHPRTAYTWRYRTERRTVGCRIAQHGESQGRWADMQGVLYRSVMRGVVQLYMCRRSRGSRGEAEVVRRRTWDRERRSADGESARFVRGFEWMMRWNVWARMEDPVQ